MKRAGRQSKLKGGLFLGVAIFSLLFLISGEGKAADPAADYPTRSIECVTHVAPGSGMDVMARLMGDIVQKEKLLSQSLVVVNKPGSGGSVATGYLFERKGNPHLLQVVSSATFLCTPILEKLPYTYKSFTPIANMAVDGSVLVVRSDSPFKTIGDLMAEAKKRPKELIQGSGSYTSNEGIMGQAIQRLKGVQWNFISFAGGSNEAMLSVLNGTVNFAIINPYVTLDHVRTGKLRVLLTVADNRYEVFKDVPTVKEAGLGNPIVTYRGFIGPPNMPDYAVKKLEATFKKISENDRFKKYIGDSLMQLSWKSSQEYGKFLGEESDRWTGWLSEAGLLKKK